MTGTRRRSVTVRQNIRPAPLRTAVLKRLIVRALDAIPAEEADVRIRVVDDAEMARWNRRAFGRSGSTNVICFPEEEPRGARPRPAGDIVISAPTCLAQTRGWRATRESRVLFFVIHGVLHLLGYDHEAGGAAARAMRRAEIRVWRAAAGGAGERR